MIYFLAPISIPNMKALAQILFEITCTQDFQILFSKGHNSEKGHNLDMKKYGSTFFHEESLYEIQNPSIHRLTVSNFTEKWKKKLKISKFRNFVKIWGKVLKRLSDDLLLSPKQYTKYEGHSSNAFLRYLAHKIFKFCFQRDITQKRSITRT